MYVCVDIYIYTMYIYICGSAWQAHGEVAEDDSASVPPCFGVLVGGPHIAGWVSSRKIRNKMDDLGGPPY